MQPVIRQARLAAGRARGATFTETGGIEIGSNDGGSGNPFTGTTRHILTGPGADQDQVAATTGTVNDEVFGMFFDTDGDGFRLDNILINLSTDTTQVLPTGGALLKLELWKINADLGDLSTTNVATTFPDPELVFTGTGNFSDPEIPAPSKLGPLGMDCLGQTRFRVQTPRMVDWAMVTIT